MQIVLDKAAEVNSIHYYFLVVEGCLCSSIALVWMLVVTTQVWASVRCSCDVLCLAFCDCVEGCMDAGAS